MITPVCRTVAGRVFDAWLPSTLGYHGLHFFQISGIHVSTILTMLVSITSASIQNIMYMVTERGLAGGADITSVCMY